MIEVGSWFSAKERQRTLHTNRNAGRKSMLHLNESLVSRMRAQSCFPSAASSREESRSSTLCRQTTQSCTVSSSSRSTMHCATTNSTMNAIATSGITKAGRNSLKGMIAQLANQVCTRSSSVPVSTIFHFGNSFASSIRTSVLDRVVAMLNGCAESAATTLLSCTTMPCLWSDLQYHSRR